MSILLENWKKTSALSLINRVQGIILGILLPLLLLFICNDLFTKPNEILEIPLRGNIQLLLILIGTFLNFPALLIIFFLNPLIGFFGWIVSPILWAYLFPFGKKMISEKSWEASIWIGLYIAAGAAFSFFLAPLFVMSCG